MEANTYVNSQGRTYRTHSWRATAWSGQETENGDPMIGDPAEWRRAGYATAVDRNGYVYVCPFDVEVIVRPDGSATRSDTLHGQRRKFSRPTADAPWQRDTSEEIQAHAAAQTAGNLAGTPWQLPDGRTFDTSQGRGAILQWFRSWPDSYAKREAVSLWLNGKPGRGKSQLVAWLIQELGQRGVVVDRWLLPSVTRSMRAGYDDNPSAHAARLAHRQRVERAKTVPVLVLEDLSADRAAEDVRQLLYDVLDARIAANLPTIFTDNATPDAIESAGWDPRVASRCRHAMVLELRGPDYRGQHVIAF